MKELKTITECQLLYLALETLEKRISDQEYKKKKCGKDNIILLERLRRYNEQYKEVYKRITEIENTVNQ